MPPRSHLSQSRLDRERAMTTAKPWCAAQSLQPARSSSREWNSLGGMGARERGGGGEAPGEMGMRSRSGVPGRSTPNMAGGLLKVAAMEDWGRWLDRCLWFACLELDGVCGVRGCVSWSVVGIKTGVTIFSKSRDYL